MSYLLPPISYLIPHIAYLIPHTSYLIRVLPSTSYYLRPLTSSLLRPTSYLQQSPSNSTASAASAAGTSATPAASASPRTASSRIGRPSLTELIAPSSDGCHAESSCADILTSGGKATAAHDVYHLTPSQVKSSQVKSSQVGVRHLSVAVVGPPAEALRRGAPTTDEAVHPLALCQDWLQKQEASREDSHEDSMPLYPVPSRGLPTIKSSAAGDLPPPTPSGSATRNFSPASGSRWGHGVLPPL